MHQDQYKINNTQSFRRQFNPAPFGEERRTSFGPPLQFNSDAPNLVTIRNQRHSEAKDDSGSKVWLYDMNRPLPILFLRRTDLVRILIDQTAFKYCFPHADNLDIEYLPSFEKRLNACYGGDNAMILAMLVESPESLQAYYNAWHDYGHFGNLTLTKLWRVAHILWSILVNTGWADESANYVRNQILKGYQRDHPNQHKTISNAEKLQDWVSKKMRWMMHNIVFNEVLNGKPIMVTRLLEIKLYIHRNTHSPIFHEDDVIDSIFRSPEDQKLYTHPEPEEGKEDVELSEEEMAAWAAAPILVCIFHFDYLKTNQFETNVYVIPGEMNRTLSESSAGTELRTIAELCKYDGRMWWNDHSLFPVSSVSDTINLWIHLCGLLCSNHFRTWLEWNQYTHYSGFEALAVRDDLHVLQRKLRDSRRLARQLWLHCVAVQPDNVPDTEPDEVEDGKDDANDDDALVDEEDELNALLKEVQLNQKKHYVELKKKVHGIDAGRIRDTVKSLKLFDLLEMGFHEHSALRLMKHVNNNMDPRLHPFSINQWLLSKSGIILLQVVLSPSSNQAVWRRCDEIQEKDVIQYFQEEHILEKRLRRLDLFQIDDQLVSFSAQVEADNFTDPRIYLQCTIKYVDYEHEIKSGDFIFVRPKSSRLNYHLQVSYFVDSDHGKFVFGNYVYSCSDLSFMKEACNKHFDKDYQFVPEMAFWKALFIAHDQGTWYPINSIVTVKTKLADYEPVATKPHFEQLQRRIGSEGTEYESKCRELINEGRLQHFIVGTVNIDRSNKRIDVQFYHSTDVAPNLAVSQNYGHATDRASFGITRPPIIQELAVLKDREEPTETPTEFQLARVIPDQPLNQHAITFSLGVYVHLCYSDMTEPDAEVQKLSGYIRDIGPRLNQFRVHDKQNVWLSTCNRIQQIEIDFFRTKYTATCKLILNNNTPYQQRETLNTKLKTGSGAFHYVFPINSDIIVSNPAQNQSKVLSKTIVRYCNGSKVDLKDSDGTDSDVTTFDFTNLIMGLDESKLAQVQQFKTGTYIEFGDKSWGEVLKISTDGAQALIKLPSNKTITLHRTEPWRQLSDDEVMEKLEEQTSIAADPNDLDVSMDEI